MDKLFKQRAELWENHKIWVSVTLDTIDDSETSFVWNISQYIEDGIEGSRKKDTWDFWKHINSFSEKYMYWDEDPMKCLKVGIKEALKLI